MSQIRALLWVAVSSAPQAHEDKASLPAQEAALTALADAHGWAVVDVLRVPGHSRAYLDIHECAADMRGQGITAFDDLLRHWKARDFDVLACQDGDRFGRSQSLYSYVVERTMQTGARLYMLSNGWVDSANFRMMISMGGYKAASDIDQLVKRRQVGLAKRAERGLPPGLIPITHQLVRDERGKAQALVLNPARARLIDDLYDCLVNLRLPYGRTAEELARRGHRMPDGTAISSSAAYRLVTNPVLWGHIAYGIAPKSGRRPSLWVAGIGDVPQDVLVTWNAVEPAFAGERAERLAAEIRRRHDARGKARPATIYAVSGLFVCAECGRHMAVEVGRWAEPRLSCRGLYKIEYGAPVCSAKNSRPLAEVRAWLQRMVDAWVAQGMVTVSAQTPVSQHDAVDAEARAVEAELDALITQQGRAAQAARFAYQKRIDTLAEQLAQLAGRRDALASAHADTLARAQRERRALADIQAAGGSFWELPEPVIHQHLHRLLGDYRIAIPADRKADWLIVPKPARRSLKP